MEKLDKITSLWARFGQVIFILDLVLFFTGLKDIFGLLHLGWFFAAILLGVYTVYSYVKNRSQTTQ